MHEYAHLWATALRKGNAEEWRNVVELMKDLLDGVDPRKVSASPMEGMEHAAAKYREEREETPRFQKVEDKDELEKLDKEKTFRMYSGMQEVDGRLYSPMAAIIGGKRADACL